MNPLCVALLLRLTTAAGPLTLDDALALAARRSLDLEVARADEASAAADLTQSYQGVLPRLDLSLGFGHQFEGPMQQVEVVPNPTSATPPYVRTIVNYPANDFGVYQAGLSLAWTVFDGLASWNHIAASKSRVTAAQRDIDETGLRVAFEVTRRFYEVVKQQLALQVRRDTASLSAELVKRADALFAAGRGTKADTYATRVNLANDQIAVNTQVAVLARARTDLSQALGLPSDAGLEVVPPSTLTAPGGPAAEELPEYPALVRAARQRRPLLVSRKLAVEAADADVSRAQGAWWPVVALQGNYQKTGPDLTGASGIFGDPPTQYIVTAQATVSFNIFAGGETVAGVRRAEAQARRAQALLQQGEQLVAGELSIAREQVATLADSVKTSRELLDAAEKTLHFSREQLEVGLASQLEVRDAAQKLAQARLTSHGTLVDLIVARADLQRALGGPGP